MKRYGNLWSEVTSFENLAIAAHKAQQGKRYRDNWGLWLNFCIVPLSPQA